MFQKRISGMLLALFLILCCNASVFAVPSDATGLPSFGPPPESERPDILYYDPISFSGSSNIGSVEYPHGCWIGQEEPDIIGLPINENRTKMNKNHKDSSYFETVFLWDTNRGGWIDTNSKSLRILYPDGNGASFGIPYSYYQKDPFILRYVGHSEPTTTLGAKIAAKHNAKWYVSRGMWAYQTAQFTVVKIFPNGMTYTDDGLSLEVVEHNNDVALSYMPTLPTKDAVDFEDVQMVIVKKDGTVELVPFKNNKD